MKEVDELFHGIYRNGFLPLADSTSSPDGNGEWDQKEQEEETSGHSHDDFEDFHHGSAR